MSRLVRPARGFRPRKAELLRLAGKNETARRIERDRFVSMMMTHLHLDADQARRLYDTVTNAERLRWLRKAGG